MKTLSSSLGIDKKCCFKCEVVASGSLYKLSIDAKTDMVHRICASSWVALMKKKRIFSHTVAPHTNTAVSFWQSVPYRCTVMGPEALNVERFLSRSLWTKHHHTASTLWFLTLSKPSLVSTWTFLYLLFPPEAPAWAKWTETESITSPSTIGPTGLDGPHSAFFRNVPKPAVIRWRTLNNRALSR